MSKFHQAMYRRESALNEKDNGKNMTALRVLLTCKNYFFAMLKNFWSRQSIKLPEKIYKDSKHKHKLPLAKTSKLLKLKYKSHTELGVARY